MYLPKNKIRSCKSYTEYQHGFAQNSYCDADGNWIKVQRKDAGWGKQEQKKEQKYHLSHKNGDHKYKQK